MASDDNEMSDTFLSFTSSGDSNDDSFVSIPSLSENLEAQFSDVPKNFNVIHINAQSIPAHFPDMLASFDNKNIHAILVSESWLKPCLSSVLYPLPGFRLIRNDRTNAPGGGVAIYLRAHIPFSVVSTSAQPPPPNSGEHVFIEVLLSHTKILLGVYYSHSSRVNYFDSFEMMLHDLTPLYSHTIIMGDFNTCLIQNDYRSTRLRSIIDSSNMHILPSTATHFFPNCSPSLLDLLIVSSIQHVAKHGQMSADAFSYHDLIFLSYKIRPPKPRPTIILQRNFSGINEEHFLADAKKIDWSPVMDAESTDEQLYIFNTIITGLYDIHAPLRRIKIKHQPAPWLTTDIKSLMHKKIVAKLKYKLYPDDSHKENYAHSRNRCNRVCRDAQRRHIHESVENEDPAKVWKFLRSLGVGKSRQNSTPNNLDIDSLNKHFSSSSNIMDLDKNITLQRLSTISTPDHQPFFFSQFSACDVKRSILSITSNAVGTDGISRNMIVPILDIILPILCHILNNSISNATVPSIWKEAQIIPIPKKLNPQSFSEYRPISILPFLSKVLERLVHQQLHSFLIRHQLLNPFQSGFRPGHSTTTALVKITEDIRFGMENRELTLLTLLDFSNAFNTVDFDVLLALLRSINISPTAIDWFRSYLSGRRQRICLDESVSSWCDITVGVPQGGVLSPLLFAIFINSISQRLSSSYHLYADDLQIYSQAPLSRLVEAINMVNNDLCYISDWSKSYGLQVNPLKTQVIILGSSRTICNIDWDSLPNIFFEGVKIPYSKTVKNLGIIFDECLTWIPQLEIVSRKTFAAAGSLRRLRNFLPTATKVALAQSLLLPILDYADACYLDLTEDQLNKLERLQNFSIRFIFGLRKYDHVSEFRTKLKWLPIRHRRNAHILSLLYNILFNPSSPQYLKERFEYLSASNSLCLRSSENLMLKFPPHTTSFYDRSFSVEAVRLWNALPLDTKRAPSLNVFKDKVKDHYLSC